MDNGHWKVTLKVESYEKNGIGQNWIFGKTDGQWDKDTDEEIGGKKYVAKKTVAMKETETNKKTTVTRQIVSSIKEWMTLFFGKFFHIPSSKMDRDCCLKKRKKTSF